MLPTLLHNDSRWLGRSVQRAGVSPTTHLLRVPHAGWLLGVGHLHRGDAKPIGGKPKAATLRPPPEETAAARRAQRRRSGPFVFGSQYTHFFYSVDASPPHPVLASSGELCLQSAVPGVDDCESIQFIMGLALEPGGRRLLLSYGVNDCSARVAHVELERVRGMLRYAV